MLAHSRNRSTGVRVGLVTKGSKPAGVKPIKSAPMLVNKVDIHDYGAILVPLIKSLHNDDILKHIIYRDPNEDQAMVESLLKQAEALDGCKEGLGCAGWRDDEPVPFSASERAARELRRQAFQHRVDARLMEDRLKSRGFATSNAQIKAEVAFFHTWNDWRHRFEKYLKNTLEDAWIVKGSDFEELQRYDMDLQRHRMRYSELARRSPTRPYSTAVPNDGGIPWTGIIAVAALFGVAAIVRAF